MKIQVFSDVHLEFGPCAFPHTDADLIVAAGDIGVGLQGLHWLKQARVPVVYVAGNHEFYLNDYETMLAALRRQAAGTHVQFLEQACFIYNDVRFLGCTLWTGLENADIAALYQRIADFKRIHYAGGSLLLNDYVRLHQTAKAWLEAELARPYHGLTIVVTHHAPLLQSWHRDPHSVARPVYCNPLDGLLKQHQPAIWIHGHTHARHDYLAYRSRILCNPRGYVGRALVDDFEPTYCLTV